MLASQNADGPRQDRTAERAILLLGDALQIVDEWGDCPEIGARLQHVIDSIRDRGRGR
jgi:hypothetical protein